MENLSGHTLLMIALAIPSVFMLITLIVGIVKREKWVWTALGRLFIYGAFETLTTMALIRAPRDAINQFVEHHSDNGESENRRREARGLSPVALPASPEPSYKSPLQKGGHETYEELKRGIDELGRNPASKDLDEVKKLKEYFDEITADPVQVDLAEGGRAPVVYDPLLSPPVERVWPGRMTLQGSDGKTYVVDYEDWDKFLKRRDEVANLEKQIKQVLKDDDTR